MAPGSRRRSHTAMITKFRFLSRRMASGWDTPNVRAVPHPGRCGLFPVEESGGQLRGNAGEVFDTQSSTIGPVLAEGDGWHTNRTSPVATKSTCGLSRAGSGQAGQWQISNSGGEVSDVVAEETRVAVPGRRSNYGCKVHGER